MDVYTLFRTIYILRHNNVFILLSKAMNKLIWVKVIVWSSLMSLWRLWHDFLRTSLCYLQELNSEVWNLTEEGYKMTSCEDAWSCWTLPSTRNLPRRYFAAEFTTCKKLPEEEKCVRYYSYFPWPLAVKRKASETLAAAVRLLSPTPAHNVLMSCHTGRGRGDRKSASRITRRQKRHNMATSDATQSGTHRRLTHTNVILWHKA